MVHLTVPHGLEQSGGAAWGTRDVCQGPVEFLLALEHDATVREILRIVFAQQQETGGDWPQWFMLEPYAQIRDRHSHGDVIVWPLKALCDYVEATDDLAFLDEPVAWRREDDFAATAHAGSGERRMWRSCSPPCASGSSPARTLIRYGEGDWNDSLQPADPQMRDWMVSSWTVALLFQQLNRYAEVLTRAGRAGEAAELGALAAAMRADFNRHLVRDGTVAGYALFDTGLAEPELLLHPSDTRTGLRYSLLPMTRSIIGGLFTDEQARHHLRLIREHLLFPDGARLMDRPVAYHGGPEQVFRRAEFGGVLRARDRADVRPRPPALRRGDGGAGRGRRALGGAAGGEPGQRRRGRRERLAAPAQRLLQQQRRGLPRPLPRERRVGAGAGGHRRRRRRVADLLERAGPLHEPAALPRARHPPALRPARRRAGAAAGARAGHAGKGHRRAGERWDLSPG